MRQTNGVDVLVVGAGPTGLVAAAEAAIRGLSVRIVERRAARAEQSKALVLHARTMEALEALGCAEALIERGQVFRALNVHTRPGVRSTRVDLVARSWGDTRYPFWLSIPQFETEQIVESRLSELGVEVEWGVTLTGLEDHGEHVTATCEGEEGEFVFQASWVLGCDGGRSATRELVGIGMEREDLGVEFALADIRSSSDLTQDEGHVVLADGGLLLIVPMPEPGVWRLIAQVDASQAPLDGAGWEALVGDRLGRRVPIDDVGWSSRFSLTSGVASRFRQGRVFLLGDAAHVHSPVGGQGLNTGVQDANNLVWKLAMVERGHVGGPAAQALIGSYDEERRPIVEGMVHGTARATRALTSRGRLRKGALRGVARVALMSDRVKDRLGRGVGMLDLLTGGERRAPNPELGGGERLHDHVDPNLPTLLRWGGEELLVRPDRVVAGPWMSPYSITAEIQTSGGAS